MKATHWVLVVILCSLLTPAAIAQVAPGNATNFAMIGITRGQTLQINVVAFPPDPCVGQISFLNSNGAVVGQVTFLDLPGSTLVSKGATSSYYPPGPCDASSTQCLTF